MASDLYSDDSGGSTTTTSPRISFSYDLPQSDTVPVEHLLRSCSSSTVDFNFNIHENSDLHCTLMADELFFDGKILTTPMKSKSEAYTPLQDETEKSQLPPLSPPLPPVEDDELNLKQQNWRSIWGFKRSNSCGNGYTRSLCLITLLSRSNSTGSSTSSKDSSSSSKGLDQNRHQNLQKKPPLQKSGYGYGNYSNVDARRGIRVDPVLNLGFGSFFSGNSKNRRKK